MKKALVILISCANASAFAQNLPCDEVGGWELLNQGNMIGGFEALKGCEHSPDVTTDTLWMLGYFYTSAKLEGLDISEPALEYDQIKKGYAIYERAALLGKSEAIDTLQDYFQYGDARVFEEAQPDKAECLQMLSGREYVQANEVEKCL